MTFSTHVLDAALGRPAVDVPTALHHRADGGWRQLAAGRTDSDGRLRALTESAEPVELSPGTYRVDFETAAYFAATGQVGFYPVVSIAFEVRDGAAHHHVPLLLSPFAYSTYRGS